MMEVLTEIQIGNQIWSGENLQLTHFSSGELIPCVEANEDWENAGSDSCPACCYYNNQTENGSKLGLLYNSFVINKENGFVPQGWRIPTHADWEELIRCLGGTAVAGVQLKSTEMWLPKHNGSNGSGNNSSGFNAFPSGQRDFMGKFHRLNISCCWWVAREEGDETNWFYYLDHDSDKLEKGLADVEDGFSLRLIKIDG